MKELLRFKGWSVHPDVEAIRVAQYVNAPDGRQVGRYSMDLRPEDFLRGWSMGMYWVDVQIIWKDGHWSFANIHWMRANRCGTAVITMGANKFGEHALEQHDQREHYFRIPVEAN